MALGDLDAVLATLHPDALAMGDANGTARTAINVIHGADKFARFFLGLLARYGPDSLAEMEPVLLNGQLGVATAGWIGATERETSPARVAGFAVRDGLVCAAYDIANPEKFAGVRLPDWPAQPAPYSQSSWGDPQALGTSRPS
jgi:RNA polymerase sigma-70 factor (ECF subfamily)